MTDNSTYFCRLLNIDPAALSTQDREFYDSHRLGKRKEQYGFTREERDWIDRMNECESEGAERK